MTNGTEKISWGATQTAAVNNYSTTFDGTANNWVATDSGKLVDGAVIANALALKQNKVPAGTAGNVVTYTGTAGVVGSNTVASAATYDQQSGALTNGSAIANVTLVETKQNKIAATTTNYTYDATNRPNADGSLVATTATAGTVAERPIVSAATYDSTTGALTNGSAIPNVTALDTRQKKKVCAGWPSDVAVADRSDANCWLWELPD